ncbi:MAG: hypothetical protein IJ565_03410 [Bacilli bacterium]|nr:hypothetical protein [Bacilli bacterium]
MKNLKISLDLSRKNISRNYDYAKNIEFDDILDCMVKLMGQKDSVVTQ